MYSSCAEALQLWPLSSPLSSFSGWSNRMCCVMQSKRYSMISTHQHKSSLSIRPLSEDYSYLPWFEISTLSVHAYHFFFQLKPSTIYLSISLFLISFMLSLSFCFVLPSYLCKHPEQDCVLYNLRKATHSAGLHSERLSTVSSTKNHNFFVSVIMFSRSWCYCHC